MNKKNLNSHILLTNADRPLNRKQFLRNLGYSALASMPALLLPGCYFDLEYSPYMTNVDYENLNAGNLEKIAALEAGREYGNTYRFGLISDTHHFYTETKKVIGIFNSRSDLDFVVIIGDTTNQGLLREFNWGYDVIKKLKYPYINIIGNHDCLDYGIEIFEKMYGPLNFSFSFLGTEFICFHNNNWESSEPDYGWLAQKASSSTAAHRVLFAHIDNSGCAFNRFSQSQVDTFNNIISEYFDCAIHGHAHENSKEDMVNGVPRYQIGSPGYGHYMVVTFNNGIFEVERCTF
ncbi:MAG TPA: metallophosphoesterase [Spirochaetota bacterium]|nr:metallophosphoesterase [Spirochaetota bacterium]HQP47207.1 metallophosphoesterase [Spirochaetota bacterium]